MNKIVKKYYAKSQGEINLSWKQVDKDILEIIAKMKKDKFEPDVIISIARSGLIPGAMIAYALENKELYVVKIDFSKKQNLGKNQDLAERPIITQELNKNIHGLKVLVVDEMVVSGSTLKLMDIYMHIKHPKEVKYAVLYKQPWSEFKPDYFAREIKAWPLFPWKELCKEVGRKKR